MKQLVTCHTSSAHFTALVGCRSPSHWTILFACPAGDVGLAYGSEAGLIKKWPQVGKGFIFESGLECCINYMPAFIQKDVTPDTLISSS